MAPLNLTKPGLVLCQAAILLFCAIHGQSRFPEYHIAFGKCPTFPAFEKFDQAQFQGSWFVSYQYRFTKFLQCQNLNFTSTSGTTMDIKGRVNSRVGLIIEHNGKSYAKNPETPGAMHWNWDYFGAFTDHVTVIDTDYENYAILTMCQDLGLLHTNNAILLSRLRSTPANIDHIAGYVNRTHRVISPLLDLDEHRFYSRCRDFKLTNDEREMLTVKVDEVVSHVGALIAGYLGVF